MFSIQRKVFVYMRNRDVEEYEKSSFFFSIPGVNSTAFIKQMKVLSLHKSSFNYSNFDCTY